MNLIYIARQDFRTECSGQLSTPSSLSGSESFIRLFEPSGLFFLGLKTFNVCQAALCFPMTQRMSRHRNTQ